MTDKELRILKIAKIAIDTALFELAYGQYCCEAHQGLRRAQNEINDYAAAKQARWNLIATD